MDVPSGVEIAKWFREQHAGRLQVQGWDGLDLVREGEDYCYAWLEAFVDFDLACYYLLDVRTSIGHAESRDFLFVSDGMGNHWCEWHQQPVFFRDPPAAHVERFRSGMAWFAERVILDMESTR